MAKTWWAAAATTAFMMCGPVPRSVVVSDFHQDGDAVWFTEVVTSPEQNAPGQPRQEVWVNLCYQDRTPPCVRFQSQDIATDMRFRQWRNAAAPAAPRPSPERAAPQPATQPAAQPTAQPEPARPPSR